MSEAPDNSLEDILEDARERMDEAHSADQMHRERAEDDLRFVIGEQWDDADKREREMEGRPCLTFNILAQHVRQVTGQIRSLNPAIRVSPADSAANKDTAAVIEGMIRHIENRSDASSVYEAATESAAACSLGYWRVRADYCDGDTFDQEAMIERIYNPFSVFFDPFAKHPTRKDAQWCLVVEEMPKEDFEEQYPDAKPVDVTSNHKFAGIQHWGNAESVVVAEYFWIEMVEHEIAQLPSGQIVRGPLPKGIAFNRKRTVREPQVKWAKISANDVLEGPIDFPCRYIPIVAVTGEEWHLGEETYRSSVIRFAKDAQRMYNFARSTQAEVTALQPKAPYMVSTVQVAGLEDVWAEAGTKARPYLPYNPDPLAGKPDRVSPPIASQALLSEMQVSAEDIKRTTGIHDASLGARSNETSGKAILARKEEGQNATSIYADNMVKAVSHTGTILVDMIPRIYDTKRVVRILGEDGQAKAETINDIMLHQDGIVPVNDMKVGKYEVNVAVGPSFSARREETRAGMEEFFRAYPAAAPILGDLYAKTLEWTDSDRAAERLRKLLPPGIAEEPEDMTPEQQQMKAQEAQQQQMQAQDQQEAQAIAKAKALADANKSEADARRADAEARKAEFEAQKLEIEVAAMSGHIKALVEDSVSQVAHAMTMRQAQPTF